MKWRGFWSVLVLVVLSIFCEVSIAQTLISKGRVCWQNRANYDRVIVHFDHNGNSDWDTDLQVNGSIIASTGHGSGYSGQSGYVDGKNVSLGYIFVGGCSGFFQICSRYNARIDESQCEPSFEDTGVAPNEGRFWIEAFDFLKTNIAVSKSATPSTLQRGATGQYYTINVNISNTATTGRTTISDFLPAGITTSGAITATGGSILGCPGAGATSLAGCFIPAGTIGSVSIKVPINVAISTASSVTNTATASNGSATCSPSCSGSTTNPVTSPQPTLFIQQAINSAVSSAGPWTFSYSGTNGVGSPTLTNTVVNWAGAVNSPTYTLSATSAATTVNVPVSPGWYVAWASCSDNNAAATGNPTGNFAAGSGSVFGPYALTIPAANVRAGSALMCQVVYSPSAIRLITQLSGSRLNDTDQFKGQITDATANISTTTAGTGSTVTGGDTGWRTFNFGTHTIQQTMAAGSSSRMDQYTTTVSCSNAAPNGSNVSGVTKLGDSFTSGDTDIITCVITNTPKPTLFITQAVGANVSSPGPWSFTYSGTNGVGSPTLSSTATGWPASVNSPTYTLSTVGGVTTVQLNAPPGWYAVTGYCQDNNAAATGNPAGPLGTGSGNAAGVYTITIPGANVRNGSAFQCPVAFTQSSLRLIKALGGSRINAADQFKVQLLSGATEEISSTTAGSGSTVNAGTGDTGPVVIAAGTHTVQEVGVGGANLNNYRTVVSCSNAASAGTNVSGITKLGDSLTTKDGDAITCTITNTPKPTLQINQAVGTAVTSTGPWTFGYDSGTNGFANTSVQNTTTGWPPGAYSTARCSAQRGRPPRSMSTCLGGGICTTISVWTRTLPRPVTRQAHSAASQAMAGVRGAARPM